MRFTRRNLVQAARDAGLTVEPLSRTLPYPIRITRNRFCSITMYEDGSCFDDYGRLDHQRKMSPRVAAKLLRLEDPEIAQARREAELTAFLAKRVP